jgi:hypothetical protein
MICEGRPGEHVSTTAERARTLASKYNRKVRMKFNGVSVTLNKRLSIRHIVSTWRHMVTAVCLRYANSPEAQLRRKARWLEVAAIQFQVDELIANPPESWEAAIAWLAKYIPLSDHVGVNRYPHEVCNILRCLGFVANQHVGDPLLLQPNPPRDMRIGYIAGQAIAMLDEEGCIHPMLGDWASDIVSGKEMNS